MSTLEGEPIGKTFENFSMSVCRTLWIARDPGLESTSSRSTASGRWPHAKRQTRSAGARRKWRENRDTYKSKGRARASAKTNTSVDVRRRNLTSDSVGQLKDAEEEPTRP